MAAGVHISPYFAFRNDPETMRVRLGNFEWTREDGEPEHGTRYYSMYYTQYLIDEIATEDGERIVYMRRD